MLCPAPFIHRVVNPDGNYNICCSARFVKDTNYEDWNGKSYQKIRKYMLSEVELPDECILCKQQEEGKKPSMREHMFGIYKKLNKPTPDIQTGTAIDAPVSLDLRMNNLCNLSCRMCNPMNSSSIVQEAKKHPELWPAKVVQKEFNAQEVIDNAGAIYDLRLLGGEPSVQPEAMAILKELIRLKKTNIDLFVTTNGTNTNPKFYDLLENFTNLCITISIDAWGKQHEYIRGPAADWNTIWKNTKKIKDTAKSIMIQQTITTLNIFDFWRLEKNNDTDIEVRSYVANNPPAYTPMNMSNKWKQRAMDIAKDNDCFDLHTEVWQVLNTQGDVNKLKGFKHYTEMMDNVRKQHLINYFPTTYEMLREIG